MPELNYVYGHCRLPLPRLQGTLLIFLQSRVEKLLAWLGIEPTPSDFGSQSGMFDLSAMATP